MRIVFIHAESLFPLSGSNLRGHAILQVLAAAGHEIDLVAPATDLDLGPAVTLFPTPAIDRFSKMKMQQHLRFAYRALALEPQLRSTYDVIYAHRLGSAPLARRLARRPARHSKGRSRVGTPLIADLWEVDLLEIYPFETGLLRSAAALLGPWYQKKFLREAGSVIVLTAAMRDYLEERYRVTASVSYDAADARRFRAEIEPPVRDAAEPFRIVFHGGIDRRDGVLEFLEVFASVCSRIRAEFLLIGTGRAMPEIRSRVAESSWGQQVQIRGWVPYEEVPAELTRADLAVIPSLDTAMNRMVIPRKTFEYLSLGVPIVATALPAMRELLSGEMATLVPPDSPSHFADEIVRLAGDHELRSRQRRELLRRAGSLTLQSEVAKVLRVVEEAAEV
ncbi:MAG TPA: glycosyltransferase [Thermoanaerobaculia bacterium]|nr:glycosyltransferase [Thermoanaerobaculia bacterium]